MTALYINLLCFLLLLQISQNSIYASPIQLQTANEEPDVEDDIWSEADEDTTDEEHQQIEARLRMFSDEQQDFDGFSIKGDIAYSNGLDGRKAIDDLAFRWPAGIVPYHYYKTIKNNTIPLIEAAIEEWNNMTCLNLRPATDTDTNYISFHTDYSGCWSFVGDRQNHYRGQPLSLGTGCTEKHTILHEIGHSLGLYHEQSRSDRDGTINVLWDNLSKGYAPQFAKAKDSNFSIGYDVSSVMQYPTWAFSRRMFELNSVATHNSRLQNLLGKGRNLSFRDVKVMNLLYNCSETCKNKDELKCLNEGYISPGKAENDYQCKCVCPPTHRGERCEEKIADDYYEASGFKFCGGIINKTDQIIEQPLNSTPCAWYIESPKDQFIQIEFESFNLRDRFKSKLNNSAVNHRCLYESLELRTEDHYNGVHYCADDIKAQQKFESKNNIMILIVHTYYQLVTSSDGFTAKIRFFNQTEERLAQRESTTTSISITVNG